MANPQPKKKKGTNEPVEKPKADPLNPQYNQQLRKQQKKLKKQSKRVKDAGQVEYIGDADEEYNFETDFFGDVKGSLADDDDGDIDLDDI